MLNKIKIYINITFKEPVSQEKYKNPVTSRKELKLGQFISKSTCSAYK